MRWVRSDGRTLEVREVGPVQVRLHGSVKHPLPIYNDVMDDEKARELLRDLFVTKRYERDQL